MPTRLPYFVFVTDTAWPLKVTLEEEAEGARISNEVDVALRSPVSARVPAARVTFRRK
jgi:hypothetical protein